MQEICGQNGRKISNYLLKIRNYLREPLPQSPYLKLYKIAFKALFTAKYPGLRGPELFLVFVRVSLFNFGGGFF